MGVVIAVILLVVLAVAVLAGASRRRDRGAAGLSREARRRDVTNPLLGRSGVYAPSGRQIEAAAAAARSAAADCADDIAIRRCRAADGRSARRAAE